MKSKMKFSAIGAVIMAVGFSMGSCVSENPFEKDAPSGNGNLCISTAIRGEVEVTTRAEDSTPAADYDMEVLNNNLVVYVERLKNNAGLQEGIVRKFLGKHTLPQSISLPAGEYVVEGWTGDSVSASWDKKFYRGYQSVTIEPEGNNPVELQCNIANVIVSMEPESLNAGLDNLKVSFFHSRKGQDNEYVMTFGEEEISADKKAYFMMPTANHVDGSKEITLSYVVAGQAKDGSDFEKEGSIQVEAAHEYKVKLLADESASTQGGALIRLEIADIPVIEEKIEIFPAPTYEIYYGVDPVTPEGQIDLTGDDVQSIHLNAKAYKGVKDVRLLFSDDFNVVANDGANVNMAQYGEISIFNDAALRSEMSDKFGISYTREEGKEEIKWSNDSIPFDLVKLEFPSSFIKTIVPSAAEHTIMVLVNDGLYSTSYVTLRFATTAEALDAPVVTVDPSKNIDYTAITPYSAVLYGEVMNMDRAQNFGIRYRESGTPDWKDVPASTRTRGEGQFSVRIQGLKPGTKYEYKAYCEGFEEQKPRTFTTESEFTLTNSSFEEWSTYSAKTLLGTKTVSLPGNTGDKLTSFWGSGNEGAATANMTLTSKSTDMQHSGGSSVKLESKTALGVLAAGNLFVGYYDKTDGTNGVLQFGKEYNGSHPTKLRVYANYRPGSGASVKSGNEEFVPEGFSGGLDHGQIYIALTTGPVEIRTNPSNRKLFSKDEDGVIAYGQVSWSDAFGPDGELQLVEIPLEYNSNAKTMKPTHILIVASASKYGDYFCGSSGSVMYLDDFELVYE